MSDTGKTSGVPMATGDADYGSIWILEVRRHFPRPMAGHWLPKKMYVLQSNCRAAVKRQSSRWQETRAREYTRVG